MPETLSTPHGRYADSPELFEPLSSLRNDVGLLAEEYDASAKRQLGNFPQAFQEVSSFLAIPSRPLPRARARSRTFPAAPSMARTAREVACRYRGRPFRPN